MANEDGPASETEPPGDEPNRRPRAGSSRSRSLEDEVSGRTENRQAKLDRVRQELAAGRYDSDDLLQQSLEIMLRHLNSGTES